jgi:hypothetical protein
MVLQGIDRFLLFFFFLLLFLALSDWALSVWKGLARVMDGWMG